MAVIIQRQAIQKREERLPIVAQLYKRGYSMSQIRTEVINRLGGTCSKGTICKDIHYLLDEWRKENLGNIDDKIQLELQRIDMACIELWEQWEKSKTDFNKTKKKAIGEAPKGKKNASDGISTVRREQTEEEVVTFGNPAYIAEIRQQLSERRKLLGLYAPEKKEINGNLNASLAVTNMTDEEIEAEMSRIKKSLGNA